MQFQKIFLHLCTIILIFDLIRFTDQRCILQINTCGTCGPIITSFIKMLSAIIDIRFHKAPFQ